MGEWEQFLAWYEKFPRREARADAFKAWRQTASVRPALEVLIAAVEVQTRELDWCRERRRFIPLPATWLRGERWADEFDVPEVVLPSQPASKTRQDPEQAAREAARAAWGEVCAANRLNALPLVWQDPRTLPALQAMGGFSVVRDVGPHNADRVEKRFVAAFLAVTLTPSVPAAQGNVIPMRRTA